MNKTDLLSIGKGAVIAAAGAVLTYLSQWASGADFGSAGPAVGAILAIAANAFRKWLNPTAQNEGPAA